jgi:hypothetical protein
MPHRDKAIVGRFLPDLDPHPDRANLCCNQTFTARVFPDKLVMRSGWNPGDFFVLVDVVPTSFPFNAGGILGMTRWGAPFTQLVTSKGMSPENRMSIRAVGDMPRLRYLPSPDRINEDWERGRMPDIRSTAEVLHEDDDCLVARVQVQNPEGFPARYEREFIFVKSGYLVAREVVTFEESFHAEVSALWNTQNIGPQIGGHWANTFVTAPIASNGRVPMRTPPADLLVYFAPQDNWKLQVVDRTYQDPRTRDCPAQLRYTWNGPVEPGTQVHCTQVYYPHAASRARPSTNNPGATAWFDGGEIEATAGASAISVLEDSAERTVLKIQLDEITVDWIRFGAREDGGASSGPAMMQKHGFLRQRAAR